MAKGNRVRKQSPTQCFRISQVFLCLMYPPRTGSSTCVGSVSKFVCVDLNVLVQAGLASAFCVESRVLETKIRVQRQFRDAATCVSAFI
jgi:hypothetical protein